MEIIKVEFKLETEFYDENDNLIKLDPKHVKFPTKTRKEDAGYDLYSAESGILRARAARIFHTGLRLSVPYGWFYEIKGRSSLGMKNIIPFIGTIDATYNGHVRVKLFNFNDFDYVINAGDRIAQLIFHKQYCIEPIEVDVFSDEYNTRGIKGFGSSGK